MTISVEEIEKKWGRVEIPPARRGYFTILEFWRIRSLLFDYELELINGEITVNKRSPLQSISIADFKRVAEEFPDHRIELINGEIMMMPPPDEEHQDLTTRVIELWAPHLQEINSIGCHIAGSNRFFEVPDEFRDEEGAGPSDICPDAVIYYRGYHRTNRRPPALLAVEVLSFSNRQNIERDLLLKRGIYAALEVPAYWIIDRRDQSVLAHTEPHDDGYAVCEKFKGDQVLPAPGLDFLRITPAQIFEEI
ncbi:MAG TPA: Uma2 family endonuclease [Blastocatellia bacterium]|nr:Uma2 family endonuclease [Blastocatellia bacterium]